MSDIVPLRRYTRATLPNAGEDPNLRDVIVSIEEPNGKSGAWYSNGDDWIPLSQQDPGAVLQDGALQAVAEVAPNAAAVVAALGQKADQQALADLTDVVSQILQAIANGTIGGGGGGGGGTGPVTNSYVATDYADGYFA